MPAHLGYRPLSRTPRRRTVHGEVPDRSPAPSPPRRAANRPDSPGRGREGCGADAAHPRVPNGLDPGRCAGPAGVARPARGPVALRGPRVADPPESAASPVPLRGRSRGSSKPRGCELSDCVGGPFHGPPGPRSRPGQLTAVGARRAQGELPGTRRARGPGPRPPPRRPAPSPVPVRRPRVGRVRPRGVRWIHPARPPCTPLGRPGRWVRWPDPGGSLFHRAGPTAPGWPSLPTRRAPRAYRPAPAGNSAGGVEWDGLVGRWVLRPWPVGRCARGGPAGQAFEPTGLESTSGLRRGPLEPPLAHPSPGPDPSLDPGAAADRGRVELAPRGGKRAGPRLRSLPCPLPALPRSLAPAPPGAGARPKGGAGARGRRDALDRPNGLGLPTA